MKPASHPIVKDLVLVGGGHTHAIALKMFAMKPLPGVRLTLITEASQTPYSGMLPGHVAGLYTHDECHIDLRPLAEFTQAQLLIDRVTGLDLKNDRVLCRDRPPIAFDLLSINIGSTPATLSVPGASECAIPVKPVSRFLATWSQVVEQLAQAPDRSLCLGIAGGGAGGVELALAMQHHLDQILRAAQQPTTNLEIHLFHRDAELMSTYNRWVRRRFHELLIHRGIKLHLQETVSEVQPQDLWDKPVRETPLHRVKCESGLTIDCDSIFWVTQASAPDWLREAGLATDPNGFVQVHDTLQSVSHPQIFAAGDIAAVRNHPRPKAGVFAVRQGKPLFKNLQRALLGQTLKSFIPQKQFLSLISTGNPSAIASRGPFALESPLLWRWKDQIDRSFMTRFSDLPKMASSKGGINPALVADPTTRQELAAATMRCSGCGAKVGSPTLERVLQRIHQEQPDWINRDDILIGLDTPDDAAVVRVPVGQVMVHSVDYFRAIVDDPFVFGQISTNHCLSDIFAMGAVPQSALAIAVVPYALAAKLEETLYQLLSGATKVLHQAGTPLIGGHTTEGVELGFGLSCNGLAYPGQLLRKGGMQPGQVLILTKALGTGTLFAANMQRSAKGRWIDGAIQSMLLSNQAAAACFLQHGATACTDITGFGLLGHLMEMIQASHISVELELEAIPVLDGARDTIQMRLVSSLQPQNLRASQSIYNLSEVNDCPSFAILFDPQTSGGLLATVPQEQAESCLGSLKSLGYLHSSMIGQVTPPCKGIKPVKVIT
jgi:selenide,water dikinase